MVVKMRADKPKRIEIGDVLQTNGGDTVTVLENNRWDNIVVEFNDEHKHRVTTRSDHLRNGMVKNPYTPSVYGVGYIGVGKYLVSDGGKLTPMYHTWAKMLQRCYDPKYHKKRPTYIGCTVCPEWHNFQIFTEWCSTQPNSYTFGFALDKDLIVFGNKVYSPDTCSFVPHQINSLLTDCAAIRGDLPQGVSLRVRGGKYQVNLHIDGKQLYLGLFETVSEAATAYSKAKTENVHNQSDTWKDSLHPIVYTNLKNFDFDEYRTRVSEELKPLDKEGNDQ